jgi:organic hydroperoxide reductase OsmC/OhrA
MPNNIVGSKAESIHFNYPEKKTKQTKIEKKLKFHLFGFVNQVKKLPDKHSNIWNNCFYSNPILF